MAEAPLMARIRIVIDGTTVMNTDVTLRQGGLPSMDDLKQELQKAAGGEVRAWQPIIPGTLGTILLEANLNGAIPDTTIAVTTRPNGWTLDVTQ